MESSSQKSDNQSSKTQNTVSSFGVFSYGKDNILQNALKRKSMTSSTFSHSNLITGTLMKLAMQREAELSETGSNDSLGILG